MANTTIQLKGITGPTIITGFPGFALVGSIVTEFMIEHMKTKKLGCILMEEIPPIAAIHDGKLIEPISVHYHKAQNILIIHAIVNTQDIEWKLSEKILDIASQTNAKRILCIEGVGSVQQTQTTRSDIYSFSTDETESEKLCKIGTKPLKEGYIIGMIPALVLKKEQTISCIFAQSHSEYPDSKAAASVVKKLDQLLGLEVDYKPLFSLAKKFEAKLQNIMNKNPIISDSDKKKQLSYVG